MKRCPVCKTQLFDDMDTCYGCMYRFGSRPEIEQLEGDVSEEIPLALAAGDKREAPGGAGARSSVSQDDAEVGAAAFSATEAEEVCRWTIRLEVRNDDDPGQTWAVELVPPFGKGPKGGTAQAREVPAFAQDGNIAVAAHANAGAAG